MPKTKISFSIKFLVLFSFILSSLFSLLISPTSNAASCTAEKKTIYYLNYINASTYSRYLLYAQTYNISDTCAATTLKVETFLSNDGINYAPALETSPSIKLASKAPTAEADGTVSAKYTDNSGTSSINVYKKDPGIKSLGSNVTEGTTSSDNNSATTCAIDYIGWFLCPLFNMAAKLADHAFNFISSKFLETPKAIFNSDNTSATFKAWGFMRNIANIGLVIALLMIIVSQITGFGITNYGIKKMLPRLIVAAILINVSFWICALAADLSNVLGGQLKSGLDRAGNVIIGNSTQAFSQTGNTFTGLMTVALAGGVAVAAIGGVYAALVGLGPVVLAALVALLLIFFILVAREALIIILIVLAPVAFLAYLLPNTESLFTKWRKTLTAALLVYPEIALLFGGCALAAKILSSVFAGSFWGEIIAGAINTVPLLALPSMLKSSLNAVPKLGQMASKLQNRSNAALKAKGKKAYQTTEFAQNRANKQAFREQKLNKIRAGHSVTQGGVLGVIRGAGRPGSEFRNFQQTQAQALLDRDERQKIEDGGKVLSRHIGPNGRPLDKEGWRRAAEDGEIVEANGKVRKLTNEERIAAAQKYTQMATSKELASFAQNASKEKNVKTRQYLAEAVSSSPAAQKSPGFGPQTISAISQGGVLKTDASGNAMKDADGNPIYENLEIKQRIVSDVKKGKYSADKMIDASSDDIEFIGQSVSGDPDAANIVVGEARKILDASYSPTGKLGDRSVPAPGTDAHKALLDLCVGYTPPAPTTGSNPPGSTPTTGSNPPGSTPTTGSNPPGSAPTTGSNPPGSAPTTGSNPPGSTP